MDDVDRMYRHLVRTIRATSPKLLTQPFTVGDLYQTILPYRLHRRELGLETNQDYEMSMLELLSGGRGYLLVEDRMRETLGAALRSPNPDPSVIREFSSARVALDPDALDQLDGGRPSGSTQTAAATPTSSATVSAAPAAAQSAPQNAPQAAPPPPHAPAAVTASAPTQSGSSGPIREKSTGPFRANASLESLPIQRRSSASTTPPSAESSTGARRQSRPITVSPTGELCPHCSGELPAGREISFCPHCGQDLTIAHCPACGSELEHEWKFCVTCGRTTGS
jgi:hypothetical protein